jgi:hypothetical protein
MNDFDEELFQGDDLGEYMRGVVKPKIWYRFNEPSGAVAKNSGSLGATYDAAITLGAGALAQAGLLGSGQAILFDGANTKVTVPAGPFGNYSVWTIGLLVNVSSTGEGTIGTFYDWATSTVLRFNFGNTLRALRAAATAAATNTTTGLTTGVWYWLFVTFIGDKKLRVYWYRLGGNHEFGYSTQDAALGAVTDQSAVNLIIGNRSDQSATLAGLMDEFFMVDRQLSTAEMTAIGSKSHA